MSDTERIVTLISLIIAAIFYGFTVTVFLVARKTRLNVALASQKAAWLALVLFVALPVYVAALPEVGPPFRMWLWALLAVLSIWVMYEVYRANWHGSAKSFFYRLYCKATGTCKHDERPWV